MSSGTLATPEQHGSATQPRRDLARDPAFVAGLESRDRWFYTHYCAAPRVVAESLGRVIPVASSSILDFGCGEGLIAMGLATLCRSVKGMDITPSFWDVDRRIEAVCGPDHSIPPVEFKLVTPEQALPYPDGGFDGAFAWSVFEHVADTPRALKEIHRVIRPGGAFFLQINPLYHSAHGSHLWNVVDEPWVHLKVSREELDRRVRDAVLAKDVDSCRTDVYQNKEADAYRDSLYECLDSLNMLTLRDLKRHLVDAGFEIVYEDARQTLPYAPPAELLARFPREDLMVDEIHLVMRRV